MVFTIAIGTNNINSIDLGIRIKKLQIRSSCRICGKGSEWGIIITEEDCNQLQDSNRHKESQMFTKKKYCPGVTHWVSEYHWRSWIGGVSGRNLSSS